MRVRIRSKGIFSHRRTEDNVSIESVVINENLLDPHKESVSIFFKGKNSSGILNMKAEELKSLNDSISPNVGLVKGFEKVESSREKSSKKRSDL